MWAFVAMASVYSVYLARSTPDWYSAPELAQADQQNLANQSVQTAADLFSYASDVAAAQRRNYLARQNDPAAATEVIPPKTFTLGEAQVNAFVSQWESSIGGGLDRKLSPYLSGARVALLDGRLLVAATVRDMGLLSNSIASIEFMPRLDDGGLLHPVLAGVYSGRLPVPLVMLQKQRHSLTLLLNDALPEWQNESGVGPDGMANHAAAVTAVAKIAQAALEDLAIDPVVLIPCAVGDLRRTVPLRITSLIIADRQLTATFSPLSQDQLHSLLREISGAQ
jgi:hypothetical protein